MTSSLDEIDKQLVNILLQNSRLSAREIARKMGISTVTVLKRMRELQERMVLKGFTAELDYEKLGYDVQAIISLRISKGKLFEVEQKIAVEPQVFAVYDVTGNFDCVVIAKFQSRKMLDSFLKKIQTYDFIERTETKLILNTLKEKQERLG
ncbi:Lrp/AsnC family transcriptional regulator [Candidatus Woesearchaeota archaeon]|nr:Lrp/AsnC family transcriptional regulator [Candidatus Woesearchaeota archaeon]